MAQEVVKGTGGGAQKGQGEARCQGVCNKGAKEVTVFRVGFLLYPARWGGTLRCLPPPAGGA